ncbi:N-acylneuraminate cytidylyltransferase/CMP-N,N'-diacetyllegionaminic acid synthase [Sinobacterium caligoides]|uniref:N-acylneuraminate cytidylyltransferase/CMP-N,N'-diacetyllegionaminic acid synthase n=1 Tax=Sinobacterium caligoides TaxID=933926 RepID=A0A3N2DPX2_9GAMM|nr:acylneuraminate cytidylyltransferase family protein [Sinobacterium caligoides]ROS01856.1 N-acylneuraminate cytidylyltransferase/CMP-N,N'-diacetyllegionaminic acid synthase [Sinobacterium caligoides]
MLAIITARGGSKGLPGKNIKDLCGKPMIVYTIEAALDSGVVDKVVVSSDCEKILKVCSAYDVELHKRPAELATDDASSLDVIKDVLLAYSYNGAVCLLQPTSPLRNSTHLREAFERFSVGKFSSLVSVVRTNEPAQKVLVVNDHGVAEPLTCWEDLTLPRQSLSPTYQINGAIYLFYSDRFMEGMNIFTSPLYAYPMPENVSHDVDTIHDFEIIERALK